MKHFLDLGTHKFEGLKEFTEKLNLDKSWSVYCYEPNPTIFEASQEIKPEVENNYAYFEHNNLAIMDQTGSLTFHTHEGAWTSGSKDEFKETYTMGSNCLDQTPAYDAGNGYVFNIVDVEVGCVDIEAVLASIAEKDPEAEIYIKCDIEGSEFAVLPRIIESQHASLIKEMYIEWHERFWFPHGHNEKIAEKKVYLNNLAKLGVKTHIHW